MKVEAPRNGVRAAPANDRRRHDVADEEKGRRFKKQFQRREEEGAPPALGIALGPFELLAAMRQHEEDEKRAGVAVQVAMVMTDALPAEPAPPALPAELVMDADDIRMRLQDSARLDNIARAAANVGLQAGMAQANSEYQVELGSTLFARTRLRVRAGERNGLDVKCESDSAGEREWFERHRDALTARMSDLTGRFVRLDVVGTPS